MRQPVCVGCDGRELLTLNSVTAPLTEPHLNAHKRSPKYLRSTRSFRGGRGVGASPGKQPRRGLHAEGRASQAQKPGRCGECRGLPPLGAVPALPRHKRSIRRNPEPWLPEKWAHELQIQCQSSCKRVIVVFASSKRTADLGTGPWIPHPRVLPGTWWWSNATGRCPLQGICCLLTVWGMASTEPKKLSKQGRATKNLGVEAAGMKSSKCYKSFFETVLICSRSDCAPFTCLGSYTKHRLRENRKAVAQTRCKHNPAAQLRAKQQNLQSLKYVCKGAILSVT